MRRTGSCKGTKRKEGLVREAFNLLLFLIMLPQINHKCITLCFYDNISYAHYGCLTTNKNTKQPPVVEVPEKYSSIQN